MNDKEGYVFKPFNFELIKPTPVGAVPAPRSGHRISCSSKCLYLFGGYNSYIHNEPAVHFQDFWKFNFATRKWKRCAENQVFPQAVVSVSTVRKRQQLLVYGGTGVPFGFTCSNELYTIKLNEGNERLSKIKIFGKPPQPMYGQAIVVHKNILYTIGGTTGFTYTSDVHRVNLRKERKIWKKLYSSEKIENNVNNVGYEPKGRYRHEIGFDGENIYVIGGGTALTSYSLTDIPVFNIITNSWHEMKSKEDPTSDPPFPQPRRCHGVVQLKNGNDIFVFVMGGYENNEQVFNDLWRLELATLQWTRIHNCILPKALFFHSTALTREGKMYVFGGITEGPGLNRTNEIYTAWLCIPKLSEICWEAILHYSQHINISKEVLKDLKVPERFLDKVE